MTSADGDPVEEVLRFGEETRTEDGELKIAAYDESYMSPESSSVHLGEIRTY